jgi:hypothetical protein
MDPMRDQDAHESMPRRFSCKALILIKVGDLKLNREVHCPAIYPKSSVHPDEWFTRDSPRLVIEHRANRPKPDSVISTKTQIQLGEIGSFGLLVGLDQCQNFRPSISVSVNLISDTLVSAES